LAFLGWNLDHPSVLIDFEEFFQACDFRDFTSEKNGEAEGLGIFELNFESA
jgi:hypothetical protein